MTLFEIAASGRRDDRGLLVSSMRIVEGYGGILLAMHAGPPRGQGLAVAVHQFERHCISSSLPGAINPLPRSLPLHACCHDRKGA
jgi:hypothetical protein